MHASIGSRTVNGRACGVVPLFDSRCVLLSDSLARSLAVADFLAGVALSLSPGTTSGEPHERDRARARVGVGSLLFV